jgi:hypothetical protein
MREKIEFPTNTPVLVTLDFNEGILKPGRFGDEYQYVVNQDAGIFWAKPELHQLIEQSGARAGDDIYITKREVRDGNRKRVQWEVARAEEEPAPPPPVAKPNGTHAAAPAPRTQPQAAPRLAEQLCEAHREANCQLCGQQQPINPLSQALRMAIDAAVEAREYAGTRGIQIGFAVEDIRAMAATLLINGGRR